MFTGSEPNPAVITTSSAIVRLRSARSSAKLSRSDGRSARSSSRGRTASSPPTSARYDAELSANAHGIPSAAITPAALAGPIARARLNVIEFSATACGTSSGGTSAAISDCCDGTETALATPSAAEQAITFQTRASPAHPSTARAPESSTDTTCVASSSRRRSWRSANAPAHGDSASTGAN